MTFANQEGNLRKPRRPALTVLATAGYPLIRALPAKVASEVMALAVGRFAGFFAKTRTMRRNLAIAFPEADEPARDRILAGIVANLGRLIAEVIHIPTFAAGRQGTSVTAEGALDHLAGERGPAVFVSAHLGNWELVPILFQRYRHPLTIIYSLIGVDAVDRLFLSLRRMTGGTYVEKSAALRACFKAMTRGESVALLMDQRVESGIEAEFFGAPTLFSHLPARLALRFDRPIVVVEAVRTAPGRVHVVFHEPIRPEGERGPAAERMLTQRIACKVEEAIRRHPDQWFCNKRRWKKRKDRARPAGAERGRGHGSAAALACGARPTAESR